MSKPDISFDTAYGYWKEWSAVHDEYFGDDFFPYLKDEKWQLISNARFKNDHEYIAKVLEETGDIRAKLYEKRTTIYNTLVEIYEKNKHLLDAREVDVFFSLRKHALESRTLTGAFKTVDEAFRIVDNALSRKEAKQYLNAFRLKKEETK